MSRWVRLWDDMPTDPKWRVISRRSGRPITEVIAVFVFMMTSAEASTGSLDGWDDEDVAAALDMDPEAVTAIRSAMEGKTIEGGQLSGWEKLKGPASGLRLPATEWAALRMSVFERDGFVCTYCGDVSNPLECDHIHPISRGGSNDPSNLTTACRPCNRAKRDKTLTEWRQ